MLLYKQLLLMTFGTTFVLGSFQMRYSRRIKKIVCIDRVTNAVKCYTE